MPLHAQTSHPHPAAPQPADGPWTPERVAKAERLFVQEGLSASRVAEALGGGLTKSAVIGKLHRLGLARSRAPAAGQAEAAPRPPTSRRFDAPPAPAPRPIPRRLPPAGPARPLPPMREVPLQCEPSILKVLPDDACRWPLDDPGPCRMHRTLFCAAPAGRHTYCPAHCAIAYEPPLQNARDLWASVRRFV